MNIYTIGHSIKTINEFIRQLEENRIGILIDVRSRPYSSRVPHFNRERLKDSLSEYGVKYVFKGNNLGGLDENINFNEAIDEAYELSKSNRIALMCSEDDFHRCHRYNTLTPLLINKGATVVHICAGVNVYENANKKRKDKNNTPKQLVVSE